MIFKNSHKKILILMATLFCVAFTALPRQFYFDHYDIKDGLSQNTVHKILQDRKGFMWFATKDGLNRFDGKNFRRVDVDDSSENCSFISTVFEDSSGKIWVGAHKGPYIYDPVTEKLSIFDSPTPDGHSIHSSITDITESPDGRIFIGVENDGIYAYDPDKDTLQVILHLDDKTIKSLTQLCFTDSGRLYIGTFGQGLYYTDDECKSLHSLQDSSGSNPFRNSVVNAIKIHAGRIYFATESLGLFSYNEPTREVKPLFVEDERGVIPFIRDFTFSQGDKLYIGSEEGLYIFDIEENRLERHLTHDYYDSFSLSDNAIYSLVFDREGGLWVGSFFGGVDYREDSKPYFNKYYRHLGEYSLSGERIRELCYDKNGKIFVGTEDGGIRLFEPASGLFYPVEGINEKNIHGLCIDGNNLWIGTFSEGLIIRNLSNGSNRRIRAGARGLQSDYVFAVCRIRLGDIYIGTFNGLQRYDREKDEFIDIPPLHGLFIYDITEDSKGNIWVSTYSNGVFMKRPNENVWRNFMEDSREEKSLLSNKTYSVQEDSKHNIWIMTQNGICVYDEEHNCFDRHFLGVDRIPGVAYRMEEDDTGRYWISSNHGLYCIDSFTGGIWNFTTDNGLSTNQFNYCSSLKTPDGQLYFGCLKGLIGFDPHRFVPEKLTDIKPTITELYVNSHIMKPGMEGSPLNQSISCLDELYLEPWQNNLTFNIAALTYKHLAGQKIKYRLEGYESDWNVAESFNEMVNYSNLPSGTYHLQAAVFDDNNMDQGPVYDLAVVVGLPAYKTWWAILGYIIIGLAIIIFLYTYYRRYARLSNDRYIDNYKHEKEKELYDSKILFFTNVAHEIKTPLTLIKAPLDSTFKSEAIKQYPEIKENLDVINLNVERLLYLADQLLDFRKIESGKYHFKKNECDIGKLILETITHFKPTIESAGLELEVRISEKEVMAAVDPDALMKIISNLMSNAIKYGSKHISVVLESDEKQFVLRIANDGEVVGVEQRERIFQLFTRLDSDMPGAGIGLAYARSLAMMHGGSLSMDSSTDKNVFVLTIPIEHTENLNPEDTLISEISDLENIVNSNSDCLNVLVVEDNIELLHFLQKQFIENNYKVFTAADGVDALRILGEQYIDIIVTDIMMPRMDGYELLRHIKEDMRYSHIPVIILTAKTRMEDKLSGLSSGADLYIEKPFSMDYLLVSMESLLRNRDRIRLRLESIPLEKVPSKEISKTDEQFLMKLNSIINDNFSKPDFSVEDIVAEFGISSSTFYRKVKGLLNLNPNEYIKLQRLKKAAELFKDGHNSISEVCYMVGFSSPGYFTKCFQKQFGISPKEYLNQNKKNTDKEVY